MPRRPPQPLRSRSLAAFASLLAAAALCAAPVSAHAATDLTVDVRSLSYAPAEVTVQRGATVSWQNVTSPSRVHDVVSSIEGAFASPLFGSGQAWSHRFTAGGTYTYICSIHDTMLGLVSVPITGRVVERPDGPVMRVRVAKAPLAADSPFQYVILLRDPGLERFVIWRKTREPVVEYRPSVPGSYEFVMRLKNTHSSRQTGPSGDSPVLALKFEA